MVLLIITILVTITETPKNNFDMLRLRAKDKVSKGDAGLKILH